ncbi:helix-turn-helix domain-containing protein [Streptococcus marmotae]|uniref:helix-turn-helix domain-containing protein n=1 Tax=Streptococcus marmotae TaxID=1825069 RepID=UPI00082EFEB6|nr:helix-turn-helix transcriptional regulator [Streptococcus marmotae]QBX16901.1 hypothetical protein Javan291_0025 [Streptococcus phage Javan291]
MGKRRRLSDAQVKHFSVKLRALRKQMGLTQRGLSLKLGYHYSVLSNWELGNFAPSKEALEDICTFFSVSEEELIGESR